MTDAKAEALKQALHYHSIGPLAESLTPEQIVSTAKKFEVFLDSTVANADLLVSALHDLHELVLGESPSLLDGDSGGNAELDLRIEDALKKARGA